MSSGDSFVKAAERGDIAAVKRIRATDPSVLNFQDWVSKTVYDMGAKLFVSSSSPLLEYLFKTHLLSSIVCSYCISAVTAVPFLSTIPCLNLQYPPLLRPASSHFFSARYLLSSPLVSSLHLSSR